jgi:KUP system potassium uptake protein
MAVNTDKIVEGGWFPLAAGIGLFTLMTTWKRGREVLFKHMRAQNLPLDAFVQQLFSKDNKLMRAEGTAVFLSSLCGVAPASLLHNLKHNQVLHEVNIVMTFKTLRVPYVRNGHRLQVTDLGHRFYAVEVSMGFKETPNVPKMLTLLASQLSPWTFEIPSTSFFLNRETVVASPRIRSMAHWREKLFALLQRNATKAADYFELPADRVIELGCQVTI